MYTKFIYPNGVSTEGILNVWVHSYLVTVYYSTDGYSQDGKNLLFFQNRPVY